MEKKTYVSEKNQKSPLGIPSNARKPNLLFSFFSKGGVEGVIMA